MARWTSLTALMAAATALTACDNNATIISDRVEIAAHREFRPIIRGADACVEEIYQTHGYGEFASLTLRIDRTGRAQLADIYLPSIATSMDLCRRQLETAISTWRYLPFERNGRATTVQIAERPLLIPAERWKMPRHLFPRITNLNSVLVRLERAPGLAVCPNDRSASYTLEIRGGGDVTITETTGPLLAADGPPRRFKIDRSVVEQLVERFRDADFFSLHEEYVSGITDQPMQVLTFETSTQRAVVTESTGETVGMPLVVRDLQRAVDAAVGLEPLQCDPDISLRDSPSDKVSDLP